MHIIRTNYSFLSKKIYVNNELEFVIKPLKSVIFKTQAHWPRKSIHVSLKDIANYNYMHSQLLKINNSLCTSAYLMFCQRRCRIFNDIWCITLGLSHLQDINRVFPLCLNGKFPGRNLKHWYNNLNVDP